MVAVRRQHWVTEVVGGWIEDLNTKYFLRLCWNAVAGAKLGLVECDAAHAVNQLLDIEWYW